ncbi:unnamed protein product [Tilletia controversa]|nr:unnamed protein product [Tilletia controversa]
MTSMPTRMPSPEPWLRTRTKRTKPASPAPNAIPSTAPTTLTMPSLSILAMKTKTTTTLMSAFQHCSPGFWFKRRRIVLLSPEISVTSASRLRSGLQDVGSSDELSASANVAETDGVDASKRHTANNKKAVNKKAVGACNTRPRLCLWTPTKWKLAASDFLDDPAALAAATRAVPAAAAVAAKHSTPDLSSQQIQQILAHQHQVAAQAQSVIYNPSHMSSIVGPFNGSSSYMGVWRWGLRTRPRPLAMVVGSHFPTAQSPTSSIVLPAGGMTMSGRANALAVAGLRRPGIIPMQQPSMRSQPQQMLPHGVSPFTSSSQMVSFQQQQQPQQRMYSMPMGMDPLAREGSMGMGVPMDTPSSTGGPGSILSASLLDVYSQQNCGVGGHHHHLHPHRPSMSGHSVSDFSGLNALAAQVHRPGASSAEESMKEHKRRVDASATVLPKEAAATAASPSCAAAASVPEWWDR